MKIGEFAKKHQVSIDTVRYYISEGLLTPLREHTQYRFSEIDDRVMESILLLKSMNFKLEEMKDYLFFQTIYTNHVFPYLGSFRKEFEDKLEENKKEICRLTKMNERIEQVLEYQIEDAYTRGIPLRLLLDFCCPNCKENLELEDAKISHNELMEGRMRCPVCGKAYHIRYGMMAEADIPKLEGKYETAQKIKDYIKQNEREYITQIRKLFQKMAEFTQEHMKKATCVLIDGQSVPYLNTSILGLLPKDVCLFVRSGGNVIMKAICEDLFPKNTVFFLGDMENVPFQVPMDYVFIQDYDTQMYQKNSYSFYPYLKPDAKIICYKAFIMEKESPFLNETAFLKEMQLHGFYKENVWKSEKLLVKKESSDMGILDKKQDMEIEDAIYSFQTLG